MVELILPDRTVTFALKSCAEALMDINKKTTMIDK
jgi:hypothetical protein